ncbi:GGDEF domain-containing protein [Bradymonas sediminis]|uniref:GGDEF domain-containing protein n=1 Tax=Bradymonas sediminis TaxID=1548548 RepID=A0A2Z4FKQ4_9DELT|nr:GGDEF domain-containing protein [Bradymonas sediminis]AWV89336.1 GGDEF domain-containing protein [Bradymonas sediminis]TDP73512.1 diguanylate cyclase (GGDEF)-like protein [Bradymonas sediminis]
MANDNTVVTVINKLPTPDSSGQEACLVVINGVELGKKYSLSQPTTVIGRSSKGDIQIDEDAISRSHATIYDSGDHYLLKDMASTNGTYVNDVEVTDQRLRDGDQIKIGRTIFKFLTGSNIEASYHDEIYRLTTVDGLTEIYNKRFFLQAIEKEMSRSIRYERSLSLIMCDLDHFKAINDTYGHLAGDHILKKVAQRINGQIRRDDVFARYGGEEFVLLLPEVDRAQATRLAEKLRATVASEPFEFDDTEIHVTLSLGVADLDEYRAIMPPFKAMSPSVFASSSRASHTDTQQEVINSHPFIKLADDRLYQAKELGRNRVVGK